MNHKGQGGVLTFYVSMLAFFLVWVFGLSTWLSSVGTMAVTGTGATGLEAFFWLNLNLFVIIGMVTATLAVTYIGYGGSQ